MKLAICILYFTITLFILIVVSRYLWKQNIKGRLVLTAGVINTDGLVKTTVLQRLKKISVYFEYSSWAIKQEELLLQAGISLHGAEFMVVSLTVVILSIVLFLPAHHEWPHRSQGLTGRP